MRRFLIILALFAGLVGGSASAAGVQYGLELKSCASTLGKPGDQNYWAETSECQPGESGYAIIANWEKTSAPIERCGPNNRSAMVNGPGVGVHFPSSGGVNLVSDGTVQPCGWGFFNFVGMYDAEWRPQGQRYPAARQLAVDYDASWELRGTARALLGAAFSTSAERRVIIELNFADQEWGDAHPDPRVVGSWGDWFADGRVHFLLLDGRALGVKPSGTLHWGRILDMAVREGWLPAMPPLRTRSVYFGVETRDGRAALDMRHFGMAQSRATR